MVGILATQVVDVQGHAGMIDQAMEEFGNQIHIETADHGTRVIDVVFEAGPAGEVDDDARQRFIERHITVAIAGEPLLVAPGLGQRLAKGDADILDRMMGVDMQIALDIDIKVDQAVTGNLIQHVIEERYASGKLALAGAIEVETHGDLRLEGITGNFGLPHGFGCKTLNRKGMIPFRPTFTPFVKSP